jgi:hypothetical protein
MKEDVGGKSFCNYSTQRINEAMLRQRNMPNVVAHSLSVKSSFLPSAAR